MPLTLVYRVAWVADGDTITLRNGQRVRLVQIDTPEVYFTQECFAQESSARTRGGPGRRYSPPVAVIMVTGPGRRAYSHPLATVGRVEPGRGAPPTRVLVIRAP